MLPPHSNPSLVSTSLAFESLMAHDECKLVILTPDACWLYLVGFFVVITHICFPTARLDTLRAVLSLLEAQWNKTWCTALRVRCLP